MVRDRQIQLKSYPQGEPKLEDFALAEVDVGDPAEGEILVRTIYLSLDPYMRGRMSGRRSYAEPAKLGDPVPGEVVGQVVASRAPGFAEGDFVAAYSGWRTLARHRVAAADGAIPAWAGVRKIDPTLAPISTALGVLGMPGHTAYAGVMGMAALKPGETVFVSAATGAVGSVVGQIAKIQGARAIGVAGSAEKCAFAMETLGFDACFNHRGDLRAGFAAHAPNGVDVNFENVGGEVFWAAFEALNVGARVIVCGLISGYNATDLPPGPDRTPMLLGGALVKRLRIGGLLVSDWGHLREDFLRDVSGWIRSGALKYREDIVDGLENAVPAFQGLLRGANFGKLLVRVGEDPTR